MLFLTGSIPGLCGGSYRVTRTPGNLYSHRSYNATGLAPFQTCTWTLSASPKRTIILNFLSLDVGPPDDVIDMRDAKKRTRNVARGKRTRDTHKRKREKVCEKTYLEISDGGKTVGRFCNAREMRVYESRTNTVRLRLVTKKSPGEGFHVKYSRVT